MLGQDSATAVRVTDDSGKRYKQELWLSFVSEVKVALHNITSLLDTDNLEGDRQGETRRRE